MKFVDIEKSNLNDVDFREYENAKTLVITATPKDTNFYITFQLIAQIQGFQKEAVFRALREVSMC